MNELWLALSAWLSVGVPVGTGSLTRGVIALLGTAAVLWAVALWMWKPNQHPMRQQRTALAPASDPVRNHQRLQQVLHRRMDDQLTELERDSMQMGGWR